MRIFIISLIAFFLFPNNSVGQDNDEILSEVITKNYNLDVQIIKMGNSKEYKYYIFFNNKSDSIPFRFISGNFKSTTKEYIESCKISAIQLDKIGRKEIVVELKYSEKYMDTNSPDTDSLFYTKSCSTEIFNLDTKQRIFSGQNIWRNDDVGIYIDEGGRIPNCLGYKYSITFNSNGNLIVSYSNYPFCMTPDHKEGVYVIKNGIYSLAE